ncbi:MAG: hypothetical protein AAF533_29235 [Acidobacteriota bacterium]
MPINQSCPLRSAGPVLLLTALALTACDSTNPVLPDPCLDESLARPGHTWDEALAKAMERAMADCSSGPPFLIAIGECAEGLYFVQQASGYGGGKVYYDVTTGQWVASSRSPGRIFPKEEPACQDTAWWPGPIDCEVVAVEILCP